MQAQAQKWPRPQQTHRKIDVRSDCRTWMMAKTTKQEIILLLLTLLQTMKQTWTSNPVLLTPALQPP